MRLVPGVMELVISLALTLALEVPFAYLWGLKNRGDLTLAVLVNILTNPPIVLGYFLLSAIVDWPRFALQLPLEAAAVGVEALCYWRCGREIRHPALLSICANAWSYGVGLALRALI